MPFRILIVEDTPSEADTLKYHLSRYAQEHAMSFSVEVIPTAFEFLERHPPADLIFMDIDLPGINGMEAAEIMRGYVEETPLVFVTNLAQYAVQGYQVDAIDFIVKPVEYYDFAMRMDRAMRVARRTSQETITLPDADGIRVVRLESILFIDIVKHSLLYHIEGSDEPLRRRGTITEAAKELSDHGFVKIAASCIINMAQVARIRSASVVMSDGTELFFSRSQRKAALEKLAEYMGRSI